MRSKTPQGDPPLEGPMRRTVIGELLGQAVPLAACAQPVDDGFQLLNALLRTTIQVELLPVFSNFELAVERDQKQTPVRYTRVV